MNASLKVFINTLCLYGKMVVTTIISLYLVRVVLEHIGANDFGIYSLIGGIIALLSFVNSSLMVSTQRYISVALGAKDREMLNSIFSSSIIIHGGMTIFLVITLELASLLLFDNFLNIAPDRIHAAKIVYQLMVISTVFTIIGVPYNALINAKEDLWLFSIIEAICALLKLGIIIIFHFSTSDELITYTLWIMIVTIVNYILKYIWCKIKYNECRKVSYQIKRNSKLIRELLHFSGWNAFGTLALVGRNQGVAIVLNLFWGTAINAVYGIASQVNSQLIYFSTMMTTSMTPQIMKSYGEGNISRMLNLSVFTCKLAFFLSAVFAIPLLIEMQFVLSIWLKNVPEYTNTFCSLIVFMFLIMQMTPGLDRAIQAEGKIKYFQIFTSIILLLPIPVGFILGNANGNNHVILYAMIASQIVQLAFLTFIAHKHVALNLHHFYKYIFKASVSFIVILLIGKYMYQYIHCMYGEWLTFFIIVFFTVTSFSSLYFLLVFDKQDKQKFINVIHTLLNRKQ